MEPTTHPLFATALAVSLAANSALGQTAGTDPRAPLDAVTSAVWFPLTTTSDAARAHFLKGRREQDLGRGVDAHAHYLAALAADSSCALAHFYAANTAASTPEFRSHRDAASRHAARASEAERLIMEIAQRGMNNDVEGQLALAQQLTEKVPDNARSWLALAGVQGALNRIADARASMMKAVGLAPRLLAVHTALGNSFLFSEPKDFAKALEHMQHAAALAPNEPVVHDLVGDVYRAQNNLEMARAAYTRGHELDPKDGSLLQQRGHVNSFAGKFAAARADYDSAIALSTGNTRASYIPFRALVNVYAGDPKAAIAELDQLVGSVDGMGVPNALGVKIVALSNIAIITIHIGDFAAAEQALRRRLPLMMQQADQIGAAARRNAEVDIAIFDAWLAARQGDYAAARTLTDRVAELVRPDANPRRMEPVHELQGYIAYYQGNFREAAAHFAQGSPGNPYTDYCHAVALAGAGDTAKAKQMFQALAVYNFNNAGYALIRQDAIQKAR